MMATIHSRVPAAAAGQRLAAWLAAQFAYLDEAGWRAAIAAGAVQRNGAPTTAATLLAAGDVVAYMPPTSADAEPEVPVLHADDDVVVIDKPAGLVVQHASSWPGRTFLRRLAQRHPPAAGALLEPIHRLDRSTSGVLLVARRPAAAARWMAAFAAGAVTKTYLALVQGVPAAAAWTIDAPIGPATESAVRARQAVWPAGAPGARPAVTAVEVIASFAHHALVRLRPRTGRTHQLRVHLAHAGHPLVGDPLYGRSDADFLAWVARRRDGTAAPADGPRTLLHAADLTGLGACWSAPLPGDFVAALDALRPA
ncbi:MAG: RluA family pseudouridine synthase [Planctomycetes bacterium]|nr:RluA family pseudouridine synthase [Planctomycetota bacterium]